MVFAPASNEIFRENRKRTHIFAPHSSSVLATTSLFPSSAKSRTFHRFIPMTHAIPHALCAATMINGRVYFIFASIKKTRERKMGKFRSRNMTTYSTQWEHTHQADCWVMCMTTMMGEMESCAMASAVVRAACTLYTSAREPRMRQAQMRILCRSVPVVPRCGWRLIRKINATRASQPEPVTSDLFVYFWIACANKCVVQIADRFKRGSSYMRA